jgi:hypothetical protein
MGGLEMSAGSVSGGGGGWGRVGWRGLWVLIRGGWLWGLFRLTDVAECADVWSVEIN